MTDIDTIKQDFAYLDDWEDRYRYVIELGKGLPDMPEHEKTESAKVRGCASQVWLVTETRPGAPGGRVSCAGWWRSCSRPLPAGAPPRWRRSTPPSFSTGSASAST